MPSVHLAKVCIQFRKLRELQQIFLTSSYSFGRSLEWERLRAGHDPGAPLRSSRLAVRAPPPPQMSLHSVTQGALGNASIYAHNIEVCNLKFDGGLHTFEQPKR